MFIKNLSVSPTMSLDSVYIFYSG